MNRATLLGFLAGIGPMLSCGSQGSSETNTLTVLAASSLKRPFEQIAREIEALDPRIEIQLSFAGSQDLVSQIVAGAPADVFASAGHASIEALAEKGLLSENETRLVATNRLVVAFRADLSPPLARLKDLARPGLRLVIGEQRVPVGKMAHDFLDRLDGQSAIQKGAILKNVASFEQSDLALVAKVRLGEADAAIVYASDLTSEPGLRSIELPAEFRQPQIYLVAPLKKAKNPESARLFAERAASMDIGGRAFAKFGFGPPSLENAPPR